MPPPRIGSGCRSPAAAGTAVAIEGDGMHQSGSSETSVNVTSRLFMMMFLQFFVWGAWYVSMGPFLNANEGLKDALAWAYSLVPIAAIISPFFLGIVADRFFATERVLGVLHILGGIALLAVPQIAEQGPNAFLAVVGFHALCYVPTLGLTNSVAFHAITNQEKQFPMIRVGGTIGWIVAGIIISSVLHADTAATQFQVAGAAGILLGLYSFTLPHTPPASRGKAVSAKDILGLDALALLKSPSFAIFVLCSFLICIPLAGYYALGATFVGGLKNSAGEVVFKDIATTMSTGQMSEIFFMLVMPFFFAKLGVKKMLLVGMLAWVIRYGAFAAAADSGNRPLVFLGILLHGICYDFFFVTGQIYVDKQAPVAIRSQAQGFLVLVTQGLGMFIGAQVIGMIQKAYTTGEVVNWGALWVVPAVAAGVVMLIFAAAFKDVKSSDNSSALAH